MKIATKPGFKKMERWRRLSVAGEFVGKDVEIVWNFHGPISFRGTVLAAARVPSGSSADVLVLNVRSRDGGEWPVPESFAFSLAQIDRIEEL